MVYGLNKFKEYFEGHISKYVLIGGTACDILMDELGVPFRATKDLDIVLIIEALDSSFGETFWKFVEDGGYQYRGKGIGEHQFYRFSEPKESSFPKMLELFSRRPDNIELHFGTGLTPIPIDESIVSLSAILLDEDYYNLLMRERRVIDGYSLLSMEAIILFKIRAWLDLNRRKESGEQVDMKNVKKHKNDVFRLLAAVSPSVKVVIPDEIRNDVLQFVKGIKEDGPDLRSLGIKGTSADKMLEILESILEEEAGFPTIG